MFIKEGDKTMAENALSCAENKGILQTARAWIESTNPKGKGAWMRLIMDSGSQRTYIIENAAK